jgi:uncharacterized protein YdaU (DUF1376 family)
MNAEERGLYCTLIFFLYCNDGKCSKNLKTLQGLCNCRDFKSSWKKIKEKFLSRNNFVEHKRVNEELTRARRYSQLKRKAGLKGAQKRWHTDSVANGTAIAKERKGNVIEKERKDPSNSNTRKPFSSFTNSARSRSIVFHEALRTLLKPRSQSDRTCFRNVTNWLIVEITKGKFNEDIFARVLDYARESENARNPAAMFMALLKKELNYRGKKNE